MENFERGLKYSEFSFTNLGHNCKKYTYLQEIGFTCLLKVKLFDTKYPS